MAEPEELILEGAHFATRVARDLWRRYVPPPSSGLPLAAVRERLELFVTALFQTPIAITALEPPAPATWLSRLASRHAPRASHLPFGSGTDGRNVCLPRTLSFGTGDEDARALYRLLAVQQAARLVRGTSRVFSRIGEPQTEDWFLCAEGIVIDRWIAEQVPGLAGLLRRARADALARRPRFAGSRVDASPVERCLRMVLAADAAADPSSADGPVRLDAYSPVEHSLAWAAAAAERHRVSGRYRAAEPVWVWGWMLAPPTTISRSPARNFEEASSPRDLPARVAEMRRRPRPRSAAGDEDDANAGTWVIRADEPQESVEDPLGLQRPADHDEHADPEGLADSLSDLPEARMVRTPGRAREVLRSGDELDRVEQDATAAPPRRGLAYPEWDYRIGGYRERGAIVREPAAALGDAAWVRSALSRHGRLARRMRARFERLRPRPIRLDRQIDGSEIDISAYVVAAADLRAGASVNGDLYVSLRPARRELAVALLVDISASTDAWVSADRRIVDVEKEALVVVCEALDALGDRYGVFAFSGESAADVSVVTLKAFDEQVGLTVQRRIAALDADRYTRLGAPIRHVTAALCRQATPRRLLLILSDGKPNDVDLYEGRYGVEDSRRAVAEARRQGVAVFCLTVDREAPRYAGRLFGQTGFAVLHRVDQLPSVLIEVLRQLVRW